MGKPGPLARPGAVLPESPGARGTRGFLVAHRGALGDFALTWPALRRLRARFPEHRFVGLGRPGHLALAKALGLLDAGLDAESAEFLPFFRGERLPSALADVEVALLWMEEDPGMGAALRALPGPVAWHPPFPSEEGTHVLEHHLSALAKFGDAQAPHDDEPFCLDVPRDSGSVLLHPGSGARAKNFDRAFYAELAGALPRLRGGGAVKIVLGPVEAGEAEYYRERFEVAAPASPLELARLLASASLFVGNDSGPGHVAALLGTPTIALYRRADPRVWGVRGPRACSVRAATEERARRGVERALEAFAFGTEARVFDEDGPPSIS